MTMHALPLLARQWYSAQEVAEMLGRSTYSVCRWCREQRIHARKRACGRGRQAEWEIHANEIWRYLNHGLLSSSVDGKPASFSSGETTC